MGSEVRRIPSSDGQTSETAVGSWQNHLAELIVAEALSLLAVEFINQSLNDSLLWVDVLLLEELHKLGNIKAA